MNFVPHELPTQKLQVELCYLQDWVRETGARVIVVLEGRDTAGKGGLIKRMIERVSPRTSIATMAAERAISK